MAEARIHLRDERALLASLDGLALVVLWVPLYDVRAEVDALLDAVVSESAKPIFCLIVRRGEIVKSSPDAPRNWALDTHSRLECRLSGVAFVYAGSWFGRTMATSVMAGLSLVMRVPIKPFTSEPEALDWLAQLPGAPASFRTEREAIFDLVL